MLDLDTPACRGAHTVRSVAGMINNCGILCLPLVAEESKAVTVQRTVMCNSVYSIYRSPDPLYKPGSAFSKSFRSSHSHSTSEPPIRLLGLLDCVGALGVPKVRFAAHAHARCLHVCNLACAVAMPWPRVGGLDQAAACVWLAHPLSGALASVLCCGQPSTAEHLTPVQIGAGTALGFEFFDQAVSWEVQSVAHVMAAHDRASPFAPTAVRRPKPETKPQEYSDWCQVNAYDAEEVWVPGALCHWCETVN